MTAPSTLFRPFTRLVRITIREQQFEVPENNALLRCLQYLAPDDISYGRFCWNEDCQYCRVTFDLGEGSAERAALSCKLMVQEGMRVKDVNWISIAAPSEIVRAEIRIRNKHAAAAATITPGAASSSAARRTRARDSLDRPAAATLI